MLGQPVIEAMLYKRLPGLVHFGETVTEISEGKTQVEVITNTGRRVRAKYVIGADGARSTVRNALGISFTGTKPEMLWAVIDAFIETDFPTCPEIITFQINGQSRVSWIPRERGLSRFYVLLEGEVTEERAKESVKIHLAPYKVEFTKVEWYSTFDGKSLGTVPTYGKASAN
jgi:2-polyprenyl-6-methoxyphenol hydroxylase-like FAD-dependent oxidoreductase